jgi:NADH dehydrogenase FAD-containing subunit
LRKASARILLIDKTNRHVFQPLLYQVATSVTRAHRGTDPPRAGAPVEKGRAV